MFAFWGSTKQWENLRDSTLNFDPKVPEEKIDWVDLLTYDLFHLARYSALLFQSFD